MLDTEKVVFSTNTLGAIEGLAPAAEPKCGLVPSLAVEIVAEQVARVPRGVRAPQEVVYNIVLESLVLGGAPREALKLGALLSITLVAVLWVGIARSELAQLMRGQLTMLVSELPRARTIRGVP